MVRSQQSIHRSGQSAGQGQALVETALVLPILLVLAFGVIGAGRVTQARMGVDAVAREAARAAALASEPSTALSQGIARGQVVATGYGLTNGTLKLSVDVGPFQRGGAVQANASYTISFNDLPLLSWAQITVASAHAERLDLYRSRWPSGGE